MGDPLVFFLVMADKPVHHCIFLPQSWDLMVHAKCCPKERWFPEPRLLAVKSFSSSDFRRIDASLCLRLLKKPLIEELLKR